MRYLPRNNDLFSDLFDDFFPIARNTVMKTDIHENDGYYTLDIELPGYKKENISLDINDGYLTIVAKNEISNEEKDAKGEIIRSERSFGSCSRSFYVGDEVKGSDIKAKFDNGVLELSVPNKDEKQVENKEVIMIE